MNIVTLPYHFFSHKGHCAMNIFRLIKFSLLAVATMIVCSACLHSAPTQTQQQQQEQGQQQQEEDTFEICDGTADEATEATEATDDDFFGGTCSL